MQDGDLVGQKAAGSTEPEQRLAITELNKHISGIYLQVVHATSTCASTVLSLKEAHLKSLVAQNGNHTCGSLHPHIWEHPGRLKASLHHPEREKGGGGDFIRPYNQCS